MKTATMPCPHCGNQLGIPEPAGSRLRCPHCKKTFDRNEAQALPADDVPFARPIHPPMANWESSMGILGRFFKQVRCSKCKNMVPFDGYACPYCGADKLLDKRKLVAPCAGILTFACFAI